MPHSKIMAIENKSPTVLTRFSLDARGLLRLAFGASQLISVAPNKKKTSGSQGTLALVRWEQISGIKGIHVKLVFDCMDYRY